MSLIIVSVAQGVASAYILIMALQVLNRMTGATNHVMRGAYLGMVAGAGTGVISCFTGATLTSCALSIGVALFMAGNRRRKYAP